MPRVKSYRKKDGTLVRSHSRGTISVGAFRKRQAGSLSHLRRVGHARTPSALRAALSDWSQNKVYMDERGNFRRKRSQGGGIPPYSRKVKHMYKLGQRSKSRSMQFHSRSQRYKKKQEKHDLIQHYRNLMLN